MPDATVVLHQFASSHYNEKARWGLDWKGVVHRRETHLPGPHALAMKRLSGQTATPVLCLEGAVIAGSAAILDALEGRFPERPLYPADPALRERALDFVAREVGPSGYLVGDTFSVADLCCASLLAILVDPPHPDMSHPKPMPARIEAFLARFAPHPAAAWVLEQYARHRPPSCAIAV